MAMMPMVAHLAMNASTQANTSMYTSAIIGHFHQFVSDLMAPTVDMHCRA